LIVDAVFFFPFCIDSSHLLVAATLFCLFVPHPSHSHHCICHNS
jgi:hypothetical protein